MKPSRHSALKRVSCEAITPRLSGTFLKRLTITLTRNFLSLSFVTLMILAPLANTESALLQPPNASYSNGLNQNGQLYSAVHASVTGRQDRCSVEVTKTERFDFQAKKPGWVEYEGAVLDVMPWERVAFKLELKVNIPAKNEVNFDSGKWKSFKFSPQSLTGALAGSNSIQILFPVPDVEPGTENNIIGNKFTIELKWACLSGFTEVSSGLLLTVQISGKKGPAFGDIKGTLTGPDNKPAAICEIELYREGILFETTRSGTLGTYSFGKLWPGEYMVRVTGFCHGSGKPKQEFEPDKKKTKVESDKAAQVDFKLKKPK